METVSKKDALRYFTELSDKLLLAMRYTDKNGVAIIPTDPNMPIVGESPSHFCLNGMILPTSLFSQYKAWATLSLLKEHPSLIRVFPEILPENRLIVKLSKILGSGGPYSFTDRCKELERSICPDFEKRLVRGIIETNGNKLLEKQIDLYVVPIYYTNESFTGLNKEFTDHYLSIYRKIRRVMNESGERKDLIGKCLIANAMENGKYVAVLFCDQGRGEDLFWQMIEKVKDYVVKHGLSAGIPLEVRNSGDMADRTQAEERFQAIFGPYCVYLMV